MARRADRYKRKPPRRGLPRTSHGLSGTPTYKSWCGALDRCYSKTSASYSHYGARGIGVCRRWHKFENFLADMGVKRKGMFLDRIDNDRSYEPGNCRWVTCTESNRNKRTTRKIFINGKPLSITQVAARNGIARGTIHKRLQKGWSLKKAISTKPLTPYQKGLAAAAARWGFHA